MRPLYKYVSGLRYGQDALADGPHFKAQRPFDGKRRCRDVKISVGARARFSAHEGESARRGFLRGGSREAAAAIDYNPSLIGEVITEEEIWACTTCRNCEDQCPVMNEHVDKIIDLRRYLVLTEGKMDSDAQRAMTSIERQGNPWGLNRKERENWREQADTEIPTVKEMKKQDKEFDYLFWVGSMGSYDNRSQKIAVSFAKLLNEAGVSFAILGNKEKNSGDTPRRLGNEFLFQELAEHNIGEFEKHGIKKIVTIDPHAYNMFKNEYPDFGFGPKSIIILNY